MCQLAHIPGSNGVGIEFHLFGRCDDGGGLRVILIDDRGCLPQVIERRVITIRAPHQHDGREENMVEYTGHKVPPFDARFPAHASIAPA